MKFKVGDKVYSEELGLKGEVVYIEVKGKILILVGFKGFDGHNGDGFVSKDIMFEIERKGYKNQCYWFDEEDLELVEEKNKMRNIDVILKDENLNCNSMCRACYRLKNGNNCCDDVGCINCEFFMNETCYKFLAEEYKPKIKLNKFEYDLLRTNDQSHLRKFNSFAAYRHMKEVGHFKNVTDTSMTIQDILDNCEIED